MNKKTPKPFSKKPLGGVWYAHRLEGKVKNLGIKAVRKPKNTFGRHR
ncbi:hypothetical protein HYW58_01805 [Candidatus Kaiserbacteria bacterium]|nr:hypothetical protein [Candidatus Kaiserbacteria bacterium]